MRLYSMLARLVVMGLDSQSSSLHAVTKASGDLRGVWFTSPRSRSWNGVSQHSLVFTSDSRACARFLDTDMPVYRATGAHAADAKHTSAA